MVRSGGSASHWCEWNGSVGSSVGDGAVRVPSRELLNEFGQWKQ